MKKILTIAAIILGSQVFAQSAPLNGVTLVQVEEGVKDFTIKNDAKAYALHQDLIEQCNSYTIIDEEILGEEGLFGVLFYFDNEAVLFILCRGGTIKGSLIEKKKGA